MKIPSGEDSTPNGRQGPRADRGQRPGAEGAGDGRAKEARAPAKLGRGMLPPGPVAAPGAGAWILPLLPALAAVLFYANTLPGDFVFDDVVLIEKGEGLRKFDLQRVFLSNYWGPDRADRNYRPLTLLTYALNCRIGESPWTFHLVNLALNVSVAYLAWLALRGILREPSLAALGATLYVVLPIRTEAVTNIVGRAELLSALAILGSWILVSREGRETWPRALAVGGLTFLGLTAKENAVVIPAVLLLGSLLFGRQFPWRSLACSLSSFLAYLALRQIVLAGKQDVLTFIDNPLRDADALTRALNATRLVGLYIWKIVFPISLSADYSYDQISVLPLSHPMLWVTSLGVAAFLVAGFLALRKSHPALALAPAFFVVTMAPTSNVVFPIGTIFGERLASTPALAYPLALGALFLLPRLRKRKALAWAIFSVLVALYGARTWLRNQDWAQASVMYARMPSDAPRSARSHLKAAEGLMNEWREAESAPVRAALGTKARECLRRSLEIYPQHGRAEAKLGELLLLETQKCPDPGEAGKKAAAAAAQLTRANEVLASQGQFEPLVLRFRAECLLRLGKYDEALQDLERYFRALQGRSAPPDGVGYNFRGLARALQAKMDEARGDADAARTKMKEALVDFDRALSLRTDLPEIWNNRGMCHLSLQEFSAAIEDWKEALRLSRESKFNAGDVPQLLMKIYSAYIEISKAERAAGNEPAAAAAQAKAREYAEEASKLLPAPK